MTRRRRCAQLPLTVLVPLFGGMLAVIPAVTHHSVEVRRVAFGASLVLLGVGALGVLVWVRRWVHDTLRVHEDLTVRVDSWGALAGFLNGEPAEPASIEQARRRRCRLLRRAWGSARDHAAAVSAVSAGAVVAVALVAGGGHETRSDSHEPTRPVEVPPITTSVPPPEQTEPEPSTPPAAPSPSTVTVVRHPTATTVHETATVTETVSAPGPARSAPLVVLPNVMAAPEPTPQQAAAGDTSSSPAPVLLLEVPVG